MALAYINNIPEALRDPFTKKVNDIANKLNINPNWLMQVMWAESRLKPNAVNPINGASGLIQFISSTARGLNTTLEAIRKMTAIQQLDLVYKYYLPYKNKMQSYYDVYAVTFFPALVGKPDTWVLQTSKLPASLIAKQNPIVDINKDQKITVAEFKQYVANTINRRYRSLILNTGKIGVLALILGIGIFFLINSRK